MIKSFLRIVLNLHLEFAPALRAAHAVFALLVLDAELRLAVRAFEVFELLALLEFLDLEREPVLYGVKHLAKAAVFKRTHIDVARECAEHQPRKQQELDAADDKARDKAPNKDIDEPEHHDRAEQKAVECVEAVAACHEITYFLHKDLLGS